LKNAVLKALNSVGAGADEEEEEDEDLDDETMLKLDETIAQAFRMRKKNKQHQTDVMQYKLRALDFIQELFKSNHRLDLITVFYYYNNIDFNEPSVFF
jgi:vacuolar-type H+-ATPase subunit I/STV1